MGVLVLASASGAPGVTTTALGLTLMWPGDVVLVDADRSASQAIWAGYLSGSAPDAPGLSAVLQAHRERHPLADAFVTQGRPLPALPRSDGREDDAVRLLVPGFTHLGSVDLFESAWGPLLDALREAPFDVIVDAGRTGHRGLPSGLLAGADAVGLVCGTSLASLVALRLHLEALQDATEAGRVGLVVVGPGRPYGIREVTDQFGVGVLAEIAWDPGAVSALSDGAPVGRRWRRTALARSLERAVTGLSTTVSTGHREVMGA